jgi:hypothetical protein
MNRFPALSSISTLFFTTVVMGYKDTLYCTSWPRIPGVADAFRPEYEKMIHHSGAFRG